VTLTDIKNDFLFFYEKIVYASFNLKLVYNYQKDLHNKFHSIKYLREIEFNVYMKYNTTKIHMKTHKIPKIIFYKH